MNDVFISYAKNDQGTAKNLADALIEQGLSVWWDPNLRAGEHFHDVIEKQLEEAKCVIVLWSEKSVKSIFVKDEANSAMQKRKLIPVRISAVDPPLGFRGVQTADLSDRNFASAAPAFTKLVNDIEYLVHGRSTDSNGRIPSEAIPESSHVVAPGQVGAEAMVVLRALDNREYKRGRRSAAGLAEELRVARVEVEQFLEELAEAGLARIDGRFWTLTLQGRSVLK